MLNTQTSSLKIFKVYFLQSSAAAAGGKDAAEVKEVVGLVASRTRGGRQGVGLMLRIERWSLQLLALNEWIFPPNQQRIMLLQMFPHIYKAYLHSQQTEGWGAARLLFELSLMGFCSSMETKYLSVCRVKFCSGSSLAALRCNHRSCS